MNKHMAPADFALSQSLKLLAEPSQSNTATYFRLTSLQMAAHALNLSIIKYRAIPAHPANADYRDRAMDRILDDIEDMRKAMNDG